MPISIIIVGIGNADFDEMEELDADKGGLEINGVCAKRDIVQFVAMKYYYNLTPSTASLQLAKDVLVEVPKQFLDFMIANHIVPKKEPSSTSTPEIENLKIQ